MTSDLQKDFPSSSAVLVRSMDEYLALKHGTGEVSVALAALFRDRYGDACSVFECASTADVVFIMLNEPTIVTPFCKNHARQMRERYAGFAKHLPKLTPETTSMFPGSNDSDSRNALLTSRPDESELRDDHEPEGAPRSADDR